MPSSNCTDQLTRLRLKRRLLRRRKQSERQISLFSYSTIGKRRRAKCVLRSTVCVDFPDKCWWNSGERAVMDQEEGKTNQCGMKKRQFSPQRETSPSSLSLHVWISQGKIKSIFFGSRPQLTSTVKGILIQNHSMIHGHAKALKNKPARESLWLVFLCGTHGVMLILLLSHFNVIFGLLPAAAYKN